METLNEQLWAVAKEYAHRFGEIIGMKPEHCVGDCPSDMWCFGDTMFFSLEEMQMVVDNIDKYTKRYGDKATVGYEIHDWVNWWLDSIPAGEAAGTTTRMELVEARVTRQLRPNISLKSWLDGCPREEREPWSGPDGELMWSKNAAAHLATLISVYGGNYSIYSMLESLNTLIASLEEAKAKRDREEWKKKMKSEAGQRFQETLNDQADNNPNDQNDGEQQNLY